MVTPLATLCWSRCRVGFVSACAASPTWRAAWGGDKFLVVAYNFGNSRSLLAQIATDMLTTLSRPVSRPNRNLTRVGANIGIARFPMNGTHCESLMMVTDVTLYEVKRHGKNGYAFTRAWQAKLSATGQIWTTMLAAPTERHLANRGLVPNPGRLRLVLTTCGTAAVLALLVSLLNQRWTNAIFLLLASSSLVYTGWLAQTSRASRAASLLLLLLLSLTLTVCKLTELSQGVHDEAVGTLPAS